MTRPIPKRRLRFPLAEIIPSQFVTRMKPLRWFTK
jgi:hypothetical protein